MTIPSFAERSARLAADAAPRLRRISTASCMSPCASSSAFLQSAIPAPVLSRRSLTICGVIDIVSISLIDD